MTQYQANDAYAVRERSAFCGGRRGGDERATQRRALAAAVVGGRGSVRTTTGARHIGISLFPAFAGTGARCRP